MFKVYPKFIIRTPLFAFSELFEKGEKALNGKLSPQMLEDKAFRDVISFSSKDFFEAVLQYDKAEGKKLAKIEETVLKYLIRICTRPTNFSILGTYSLGNFGEKFSLKRSNKNEYTFYSSTDMVVLYSMYKQIEKNAILSQSKLYLNNTIYPSGENGFKYFERTEGDSFKYNFTLSKFDSSEVLDLTMPYFRTGITADELLEKLHDQNFDLSLDDLLEFLFDLFDHNIIISELDPIPSIRNYEEVLKDFFQSHGFQKHLKVIEDLHNVSKSSLGEFHKSISAVSESVEGLGINLPKQTLVNIETRRHYDENTIPESIKDEIVTAFSVLAKVAEKIDIPEMVEFSEAFFKLYENEFVPLTVALDPEVGLGYPINSAIKKHKSVFLSNLAYGSGQKTDESEDFFQQLLVFSPKDGPLKLDRIKEFKLPQLKYDQLYSTYYCKFNLIRSSDNDNVIFIDEFIGPSAGRIMARQSQDEEIASVIKDMAQADREFFKSGIVAEISFCPQIRAANIFNNNKMFEHQISILTPQEPNDNIIELSDLFLTYRNGRLNLYSKKLDKFIYPILTNSFNYALTNVPAYNFLCDIQHQHTYLGAVRWKWPDHLKNLAYLPRVEYRNTILFKAKWSIAGQKDLGLDGFKSFLEGKISEMNIPRFVSMHDRGSSIFLNLDEAAHVALAYKLFAKTGIIELEEFLFKSDEIPTRLDGKDYINEYLCFLENKSSISRVRKPLIVDRNEKFNLGSEWIYVKIFCSPLKASLLLKSVIKPLIESTDFASHIRNWHYLRFVDDQKFHLRLRIQLVDINSFDAALRELILILGGHPEIIDSYTFDTYQPEVSRYGGPLQHESALQFFTLDSLHTLRLLEKSKDFGPWAIMKSIDQYLSDFGLKTSEKATFCENSTLNYREEYGLKDDKAFAKSIFSKYRSNKTEIFEAMSNMQLQLALENRSSAVTGVVVSLKKNEENFETVLESLLHIHIIRMLDARQRYQEMIIYDLLAIYYRELAHRKEK